MHSLRTLLGGLIDYAGTFPPAQLPMRGAVQRYAGYRHGNYSWMLGRFIVPVARLDEFEHALEELGDEEWRDGPWRLSAVVGRTPDADFRRILDFNRRCGESATRPCRFDSIELKALSAEDVERAAEQVSDSFDLYVEVPIASDTVWIDAASAAGTRVKVRTGGVSEDLIPSVPDLARFLVDCARGKVPFKATAGLHHPLRSEQVLTNEAQAPRALMHGFLNVFLAAAFVSCGGVGFGDVAAILEERSSGAFLFEENTIRWRQHRLDTANIATVRKTFATCFGSCSFDEPIAGLKGLGLL